MKQIADWLDSTTYEPLYVCTYVPLYLCTSLLLYLSTYYVPLYLLCTSLPSMYLSTYVPLYLCTFLTMYLPTFQDRKYFQTKILRDLNGSRGRQRRDGFQRCCLPTWVTLGGIQQIQLGKQILPKIWIKN